jgi:hypothetical protein
VKVAYWDTAQGNPPPLIGQIKGTPTVKFLAPHKKNKRTTNKRKSISDYNGERKLEGMLEFASAQQPNYATNINGDSDMKKFEAQADKYALPKAIVFTKETSTSKITKFLSTEFRRKVLIASVGASKPNKAIIEKLGLNDWLADKNAPKSVIGWLRGDLDFPTMKKKGEVRALSFARAPVRSFLPCSVLLPSLLPLSFQFAKFTVKGATAFLSKFALDKPYFEHENFLSKQGEGDAKEDEKKEGKKKEEL